MAKIPVPQLEMQPTRALPMPRVSDGVRGMGESSARALRGLAAGISSAGQGISAVGSAIERQEQVKQQLEAQAREKAAAAQALDGETEMAKEIGLRELGDDRLEGGLTEEQILGAGGGSVSSSAGLSVAGPQTGAVTTSAIGGPTGILQKKGKLASESYADTMTALEKKQKALAESITTPEAKERFLRRSELMIERSRERMDKHVYQQNQVAQLESLQARKRELLVDAHRNPLDERMPDIEAALEGPIASLSNTPDGANKAIGEWRQELASTRIKALVAKGDWANAGKVLEEKRGELGLAAAELEAKVTKRRVEGESGALAQAALEKSVEPNGRVNIDKALSRLDPTDEHYKLAAALVGQKGRATNTAWDETGKALRRKAGAQYLHAGYSGIDQDTKDELEKYDPDYLTGLRDKDLRKEQAAARLAKKGAGAAKKAQSDANRLAMQDYQKRPLEERLQMDVTTEYATWDADKLGVGDIEVRQNKEREAHKKGLLVGEGTFVADSMAKAEPFLARRYAGKPKELKAAKDDLEAKLRSSYSDHVTTTEKKPSRQDSETLAAPAIGAAVTGYFSKAKGGGRAPDPAERGPAPKFRDDGPLKLPVSYRYNKDRTRRIPVYEDGTEGAPEAAK